MSEEVKHWREKQKEKGLTLIQAMIKPEALKILKRFKEKDSSATYSTIIERALFEMNNKESTIRRRTINHKG